MTVLFPHSLRTQGSPLDMHKIRMSANEPICGCTYAFFVCCYDSVH
jgi:hypothetical protein